MTTSTAPAELVILSSISAFAGNLFNLLVYLFAGVTVFRASIHANFLRALSCLILSLMIALALGIVRRHAPSCISERLRACYGCLVRDSGFLSGTTFPIESLPRSLRSWHTLFLSLTRLTDCVGALLEGQSVTRHGSDCGCPAWIRSRPASARARWPVVQFAAGTTEWDAFILLRERCSKSFTTEGTGYTEGNS